MKTQVLGLGNPILTDDEVSIRVARQVAAACHRPDVTFVEAAMGGLRLLELIAGYERLILVDAIQTPDGRPGQIHRLSIGDLRAPCHGGSTHDLSLREAMAWGRRLGLALPADEAISIIAIEAEAVLSFGETLTPAVSISLAAATQGVPALLAARLFRRASAAKRGDANVRKSLSGLLSRRVEPLLRLWPAERIRLTYQKLLGRR